MRPTFPAILLLLILGAILNVAVAWACAAWVNPFNGPTQFSQRRLESGTWETASCHAWFGHTRIARADSHVHFDDHGRSLISVSDSVATQNASNCDLAGWPLRTLTCSCGDVVILDSGHMLALIQSNNPPGVTDGILLSTTFGNPRPDNWRALPLRPLWSGMVVNTLFYALLLWLLWTAPAMVRRRIRARRGQCPNCGYDLRGHAWNAGDSPTPSACPECGTPVPHSMCDG